MSRQILSDLVTERRELEESLTTILDTAANEQRDLSDADLEGVERAKNRMASIDQQLSVVKSAVERSDAALDVQHLLAKNQARQTASVQVVNEPWGGPTLGDFVTSPEYRNWQGSGKTGRANLEMRASSMLTRAPLQEGAAPGSLLLPAKQKLMMPTAEGQFPLLSAVTRVPVNSNSVDVVQYGDPYGAQGAAVVAELAAKPEATVTATLATVTIPTIAYYIEFSRQLAQDAPALRSFLDDQLRLGLLKKIEDTIAEEINGVTFGTTNTITGASKQSLVEIIRIAMADLQTKGWRPTTLLVNPANAATLDLFLLSNTNNGASFGQPVWGVNVVPVAGLGADEIYLADLSQSVWLLERTRIEMFLSDSHEATFTSNVLTLLCEARARAVVVQPNALVKLVVTP
jgi:HK97 family phage major capsid protein